jgi:hypothetical protein
MTQVRPVRVCVSGAAHDEKSAEACTAHQSQTPVCTALADPRAAASHMALRSLVEGTHTRVVVDTCHMACPAAVAELVVAGTEEAAAGAEARWAVQEAVQ